MKLSSSVVGVFGGLDAVRVHLLWYRDFMTRLGTVLRLEYVVVADALAVFRDVEGQVDAWPKKDRNHITIPLTVNPQFYKARLTTSLVRNTPPSVLQRWADDYADVVERDFAGFLSPPVYQSMDSLQSHALLQDFFQNLPQPSSAEDSSTSMTDEFLAAPGRPLPLLKLRRRSQYQLFMGPNASHWPTPCLKWILFRELTHTIFVNLVSESGAGMLDDTVHLVGASLDLSYELILLIKWVP